MVLRESTPHYEQVVEKDFVVAAMHIALFQRANVVCTKARAAIVCVVVVHINI